MQILAADGRQFKLKVSMLGSSRRAKEPKSAGAIIFTWVGPTANPDMSKWEYHGLVSRGDFFLEVGLDVPAGSQVWFCAAWQTSRGLNGPLSTPIAGYVGGGVTDAAPMTLGTDVELKQAA
jgi:hypothetical protein